MKKREGGERQREQRRRENEGGKKRKRLSRRMKRFKKRGQTWGRKEIDSKVREGCDMGQQRDAKD